MPKKTRTPLSDEEREARRQAERELLAAAVEQLKSSEGWLRWLKVRSSFHSYSATNQLLIALQNPNATRVAGFQKWLKLGRCVRKGEKGIKIFAPVPPSKKKLEDWKSAGADPRKRPRTLFKLTSVFDLSRTPGARRTVRTSRHASRPWSSSSSRSASWAAGRAALVPATADSEARSSSASTASQPVSCT